MAASSRSLQTLFHHDLVSRRRRRFTKSPWMGVFPSSLITTFACIRYMGAGQRRAFGIKQRCHRDFLNLPLIVRRIRRPSGSSNETRFFGSRLSGKNQPTSLFANSIGRSPLELANI